ncbi:hypothetical protein BU17DRAFT_92158 [Hysterangium stoloniferum]|nr:hypothetical protein BU17DRAFT_92158 [Hysterangium stoloniferum]
MHPRPPLLYMTSPSATLLLPFMTFRSPTGPMFEKPKGYTIPGWEDGFPVEEPCNHPDTRENEQLTVMRKRMSPKAPSLIQNPTLSQRRNAHYYLHVRLRRRVPDGYARRSRAGCRVILREAAQCFSTTDWGLVDPCGSPG